MSRPAIAALAVDAPAVDCDALVVATGAEITLDAVPGAADYALPFYTVEQALELKRRLEILD